MIIVERVRGEFGTEGGLLLNWWKAIALIPGRLYLRVGKEKSLEVKEDVLTDTQLGRLIGMEEETDEQE